MSYLEYFTELVILPNRSVKLEVTNVKRIATVYNVIAVFKGWEEPDRYIILGNHRDAWTFGSLDPSSATAVQMEVVRGMGELRKKGNYFLIKRVYGL